MNITSPQKRLSKFWGAVDRKHIEIIFNNVIGHSILDIGCGYGTTLSYFFGHTICTGVGIDNDPASIELCPPGEFNYLVVNAEQLPFPDNFFDTIILRDSLHHLFKEADFKKIRAEILRVAQSDARIIFFDPNVNFILRTFRKIANHKDEECTFDTAKGIMIGMNCEIIHQSFNTIYSLPLSGGYVGYNFIPNIKWIWNLILKSEFYFEKLISRIGLARIFCWRYIIVGKLNK